MAPSLNQIFHTEPKKIGMIEIYSNPMDKKTVKDIEKVIKFIAKDFHINLDNIPSGETLRIYIYPTSKVFFSIFRSELERKGRRRLNKGREEMYFIVENGEIHMVSPSGIANAYTDMINILVKDILKEYEVEERYRRVEEKIKDELEPKEIDENEEIEETEEIDEDELELEDQEDIISSEDIEEVNEKIEEIKKVKDVPEWLDLGWIMYKRGILKNSKNREDYAEFIKEKGVTSCQKISSKQSVVKTYNYSSESSAAIIEYIVENYGVKKILELFENPNIEDVLSVSKDEFSRQCKENIKKKYINLKLNELKEDLKLEEKEGRIKEN